MTQTGNKSLRQYSKDFKVDAVELTMRSNKSTVEIAASLGIRADLLRRWKKEYSANKATPFPGSGHLHDPDEERFRGYTFTDRRASSAVQFFRNPGRFNRLQSTGCREDDRPVSEWVRIHDLYASNHGKL